jgi:hypothetical protein
MSRSQEVNIYPTDPVKEGIAFIEYVVLKRALGDFETERCRPFGTVKSRMASQELVSIMWNKNDQYCTDHPTNASSE